MHTEHEDCTFYTAEVTGKVIICRQTYRQKKQCIKSTAVTKALYRQLYFLVHGNHVIWRFNTIYETNSLQQYYVLSYRLDKKKSIESSVFAMFLPLTESGICLMVSLVNLAASKISAPSIASLRAIAGALPPTTNRAPGTVRETFPICENSVLFSTYRLKKGMIQIHV